MKNIDFRLITTGTDPGTEDAASRIADAGFTDAICGSSRGLAFVDLNVRAEDPLIAIFDAIQRVESSVPDLIVQRVEPDSVVNLAEIAERMGLSHEAVRLYSLGRRGPGDFAPPIDSGESTRLWRWNDVARWFAKARVSVSLPRHVDTAFGDAIATLNAALTLRNAWSSLDGDHRTTLLGLIVREDRTQRRDRAAQAPSVVQSRVAHRAPGDPSATNALQACIDHARDLLDGAETLYNTGKSNIAYHLATLALEELGRRELLAIQSVSSKQPIPPTWPLKQTQNHVRKLFWAFFGAAFAQDTLTKEGLEEMQGLARFIHTRRLAGLYVDNDDDGLSIPSDAIAPAEAQNLIALVSARLGVATSHDLQPQISDSDVALQQWFIANTQDEPRREYVFSGASMIKLGELKNARDWMRWLKQQFDDADAAGFVIAQKELARSRNLPLKSTRQKWKLRIRVLSDSHLIRPKTLTAWNSTIDAIKLVAVPNKKNQLIVEFFFSDTMPIEGLWYTGWALARKFVVALNIGSRGFWWWHLPEHISHYYETIEDLERQQPVVLDRNPRLKIDWGKNLVLSEDDLRLTSMCFAALPQPGESERLIAYDYYIAGVNFLALNDVHWQCELQAYGNFHESLKAMMKTAGGWAGDSPFDAALAELLRLFFPTMSPEQQSRYTDLARRFEQNTALDGEITLSDVGGIKVLCDAYFLDHVGPTILKARLSEASRGAPL